MVVSITTGKTMRPTDGNNEGKKSYDSCSYVVECLRQRTVEWMPLEKLRKCPLRRVGLDQAPQPGSWREGQCSSSRNCNERFASHAARAAKQRIAWRFKGSTSPPKCFGKLGRVAWWEERLQKSLWQCYDRTHHYDAQRRLTWISEEQMARRACIL